MAFPKFQHTKGTLPHSPNHSPVTPHKRGHHTARSVPTMRKGTKSLPHQANSTLPTLKQQPDEPVLQTKSKRVQVGKRTHENDASDAEIPPTTLKKARTAASKPLAEKAMPLAEGTVTIPQPAARRSNRVHQGPAPTQKRKRRTPAEMAAAREEAAAKKAAVEKGKKRLEEIAEEADRRLEMMDLEDDAKRAATNAGIVRRLSDVAVDEEDGEFIGIDDVSSTDEDEGSDDEALEKVSNPISS